MFRFHQVATSQGWTAVIAGVVLLLFPEPLLGLFGLQSTPAEAVLGRIGGGMMFALGITILVARKLQDVQSQQRIAVGNATCDVALALWLGWATHNGVLAAPIGWLLTAAFVSNVVQWGATLVPRKAG
jgi:hypothetical protein